MKRCKVWKLRVEVIVGIFKEQGCIGGGEACGTAGVEDVLRNFKKGMIEEDVDC